MLNTDLEPFISELCKEKIGVVSCVSVKSLYPQKRFADLEFIRAELYSDLVIFDGSLEEDDCIKLGDNYACIRHACYLMDNVVVVSRTELPLNFIPNSFQTNVLPVGEELMESHQFYSDKICTNADIIRWLKKHLATLFQENRLPRKQQFKISKDSLSYEDIFTNPINIVECNDKIYSQTKHYLKNRYEHTAFISYRSYYYDNLCNGFNVKKLEQIILEYHKKINPNEAWKVLYYHSGSLTQDCLTEYRRWGLVNYIENIFKKVDEVWIFDTQQTTDGNSYWDSWFTQSEFISLMSIKESLPELCPNIIHFDAISGKFAPLTDLPQIPKELSKNLSVIMANSDIIYGDIVTFKRMCLLKYYVG